MEVRRTTARRVNRRPQAQGESLIGRLKIRAPVYMITVGFILQIQSVQCTPVRNAHKVVDSKRGKKEFTVKFRYYDHLKLRHFIY